jgi:rhomboid family GlyGly-CTERM serine protease
LVAAARVNALARAWASRQPWATVLAAVVALVVTLVPASATGLGYERARIFAGDAWRLWTGHWVHFGAAHLLWNLAVLLPAGVWAERVAPQRARLLLALSPGFIGVALWAGAPGLASYGGLSGVASGVLALLALDRLAAGRDGRWFWWSVLALLGAKIVAETLADRALFARFAVAGVRPVPLAHVAGLAAAGLLHFSRRRGAAQGASM